MKPYFAVLASLCVVVGCQKGAGSGAADQQNPAASQPPTVVESASAKQTISLAMVPASVKTDGYAWYGLENASPMPMKETGGREDLNGSMTTEISKASADSADFVQSWQGSLAGPLPQLGIEARPDGIYVVSYGGQQLANPVLDLPANPTAGKSWDYSMHVTQNSGEEQMKGTERVIGPAKLTLGGKQYDALEISDDSVVSWNQQSTKSKGLKWMVKGLGTVKMELDFDSKTGPQHVVIQMTR